MSPLELSIKRLGAFLCTVRHLKTTDFPYPHSRQALEEIERLFETHLDYLEMLSSSSNEMAVQAACTAVVPALFLYLPLLGFIVRSTDVRNAFEVHGPLLRLSRQILGETTRLILSSEWDYSPYTYFNIPFMPGFVLIGLPAPESSNPLLIPLAGHELGHSVWASNDYNGTYNPTLETMIVNEIWQERKEEYFDLFRDIDRDIDQADLKGDIFTRSTWDRALLWASRQSQELFCDFIGLRVFGTSFLHAFGYLFSPSPGERSPLYPRLSRRVAAQVKAAEAYGFLVPDDYHSLFDDAEPQDDAPQTEFLLSLADSASASILDPLIAKANEVVDGAAVQKPEAGKSAKIYDRFKKHIVPAVESELLSNIIEAGWRAFNDPALWADYPDIESREETLGELVLKSIEVLEIEELTQQDGQV
jgi:hypothetical protein